MTINFEKVANDIGKLVNEKNAAYGDSFKRSGEILKILYPNGISVDEYVSALTVVRILDKMFRIATDPGYGGEEPFKDIAGYGILMTGYLQDMKAKNKSYVTDCGIRE